MLSRLLAAAGGAGGLASLALPYALVSGGTLGLDLSEEAYTPFGLAQLLADAGKDPTAIYVLIGLVVVGSTLALAGALADRRLALGGGVVQGLAAAAFAYGATTEGSQSFVLGLGQLDLTLLTGLFVLAVASVVSLASLPLDALSMEGLSTPSES